MEDNKNEVTKKMNIMNGEFDMEEK
jgi:hypothetical protein